MVEPQYSCLGDQTVRVERVRHEITKPQPRLKGDRQSLLQPVLGYAATSATLALEVKPDGRRLGGRRASVPDRLRGLRRTDSVLLDHVRDSVHKSSPNPDRAIVPASAVWGPAFQTLCESRQPDWNPRMVDVRQAG